MTKKTSNRLSPEVRQRAVQMVLDHEGDRASQWLAIGSRLLPGSGVLAHLSHQSCNEGAKEGFAAAPGVVHERSKDHVPSMVLT